MAPAPDEEFDEETLFTVRIDPALWAEGSVAIPNVFFDCWMVRLSALEMMTLMQLCSFADHLVDGDPTVHVSAEELCSQFHQDTSAGEILAALDTLEAHSLLIREADRWRLNVEADWSTVPVRTVNED